MHRGQRQGSSWAANPVLRLCLCFSFMPTPREKSRSENKWAEREMSFNQQALWRRSSWLGRECRMGLLLQPGSHAGEPASAAKSSFLERILGGCSSTWGPCHPWREPRMEFRALGFSPSCCRGLVREPAAGRASSDPVSQHSSLGHVLVKLLSGKMVQGTASKACFPDRPWRSPRGTQPGGSSEGLVCPT